MMKLTLIFTICIFALSVNETIARKMLASTNGPAAAKKLEGSTWEATVARLINSVKDGVEDVKNELENIERKHEHKEVVGDEHKKLNTPVLQGQGTVSKANTELKCNKSNGLRAKKLII